jgi:hypothetical protein
MLNVGMLSANMLSANMLSVNMVSVNMVSVNMVSVNMLNVDILWANMLSLAILSVDKMSVVAPRKYPLGSNLLSMHSNAKHCTLKTEFRILIKLFFSLVYLNEGTPTDFQRRGQAQILPSGRIIKLFFLWHC